MFNKLLMFLYTDFIVEGLLKKVAKRKAATLMYEKNKMSEKNYISTKEKV
jgi:hypothetical protein